MARNGNLMKTQAPTGRAPAEARPAQVQIARRPTGAPGGPQGQPGAPRPAAPNNGAFVGPRGHTTPEVQKVQATCKAMMDEVNKTIVGKRRVLELVTTNILAGGNILFEDYPGLAKSLMADTFSRASGCKFRRIQFTPDVLPSDITGTYVFDQKDIEFKFRPGPVFCNFLLADEINRAPPKTQAALLETMQERQVSVEGQTHKLDKPYIVMATQNPVEQEGTYPLPEAQMDRFLLKLSVGHPNLEEEIAIMSVRIGRGKDDSDVRTVTSPEEISWMQKTMETVHISPVILRYIAMVIHATREDPRVLVGSSPRGSLALLKLGRAQAALSGRCFVTPDDIKAIAVPALAHRIILKPEPRIRGVRNEQIIRDVLAATTVPLV